MTIFFWGGLSIRDEEISTLPSNATFQSKLKVYKPNSCRGDWGTVGQEKHN